MSNYTITYSDDANGWTSFHSWIPEEMTNLSGRFYTFKNGELYLHNADDFNTNKFYTDPPQPSRVSVIFNDGATENKMFKTLAVNSDVAWEAVITTDLDSGSMSASNFVEKEGDFTTYIRRNEGDASTDQMSAQGIGTTASASGSTIVSNTPIPSTISIGDKLYFANSGATTLVGTIATISGDTITVSSVNVLPSPTYFLYAIKDSKAESFGARGQYMQVDLECSNSNQGLVSLFSVSTDVFKSYQ
jgi:hypothetical protein